MSLVWRERSYIFVIKKHCAVVRKLKSCQNSQKCCFSTSGRTKQSKKFSRLDCKINVVESDKITEAFVQVIDGNLTAFQFATSIVVLVTALLQKRAMVVTSFHKSN